jgi:CBS domain containing-hemolysin-like protein
MDDSSIASFLRLASSGAELATTPSDALQTTLLVLLTLFLVLLNGFFVATEFAIVKVRSTRIKELADGGDATAKIALRAIKHLDAYLSATQLGITMASLALGWIGEPVVSHRLIEPLFMLMGLDINGTVVQWVAFFTAFFIITFAHIVYGELAPKSLAIQRPESVTLWVARPITFFYWLFRPLIVSLTWLANATLRMFGIQPASEHELAHSEEELRMIITASGSEHGGTLRDTQAELLDNVFEFGHRLARQVMTHRTEILALDMDDRLDENIRIAEEGGHSRYPVLEGDIDTIIGFVHTKDLFSLYHKSPTGDLRTVMRDVLLAPETVRVDVLLRQMQRRRQHIAVLVDEYGGTLGLVTLYDLLEELVGELPDEFEQSEAAWITPAGERTWQVDGRLPMSDLEEAIGRDAVCEEACDTVGGYAFWAFGRIPVKGDTVTRDGITLTVLEMDGHRVSRVSISAALEPDTDEDTLDDGVVLRGSR